MVEFLELDLIRSINEGGDQQSADIDNVDGGKKGVEQAKGEEEKVGKHEREIDE